MISIFLAAGAFLLCLLAANRSLKWGMCAVIAVGYIYGIARANAPTTSTYMMFDLAVIGLYVPRIWRPMTSEQRLGSQDLRIWVSILIGWPLLLFVAFPSSTPLVEAVGLRANVFLLPFLLMGARLDGDDLRGITRFIGLLNIVAFGFAVAEYYMGIMAFFPKNEVTEIIYKSHDLLEQTAFRIPATFSSAHAYAGTMAVTLPLLIGGWAQQPDKSRSWSAYLLGAAVIASFLGIFMAAARVHMITAAVVSLAVTFSGQLTRRQWVRWAVALAIVGYVVAGNARLQRFTTLSDRAGVSERIGGSVNDDFLTVISAHPLGRGLAGGGTSVPYFLGIPKDRGALIENEYARIALEQGLPGLALWLMFIFWILT